MKLLFIACCLLLFTYLGFAQTSSSFPKDFLGRWQGTLLWYQTGKAVPQKVKMQLIVLPTDTANIFTWQIIYGNKDEDNRPYVLKAVDTAKGHWQVDERNGILLDQYFVGNRATSAFTVQNATIVDSYWREGKNLLVEFHSLAAKPVATTGNGTEDSPKVASYAVKGFQRAVLIRKK